MSVVKENISESVGSGSENLIKKEILLVGEYRKILNDNVSSDEQIRKKISYLESFCRSIIRGTLEGFVKTIV